MEHIALQSIDITSWLLPIISGFSSFLVTYVVAVVKIQKDLELKYDVKLNEQRLEHYKKLWRILHYVKEQRHENNEVTSKDLIKFLAELRKWYHDESGGMWLSGSTIKNGYIPVKSEAKKKSEVEITYSSPDKELEELFKKLSDFRTLLTRDLGSRRDSILSGKIKWKPSKF